MKEIDQLVIATRNPAKVNYYRSIFTEVANAVIGLNDVSASGKPEETGTTAEENAELKARFYSQLTGLMVFSEDEALYASFLPEDQQPGTKVRRINGVDEVDDDELLNHWENIVSKVPKDKRSGHWHIAYCLATPQGEVITFALDHPITFFSPPSKIKIPGWPMSSLEGATRFGKPNSELTDEEKTLSKTETGEVVLAKLKELLASKK